jgi:hypothetical protein
MGIPLSIKWGFLVLLVVIAAADSVIDYFDEIECKQDGVVVPPDSPSGVGASFAFYYTQFIFIYDNSSLLTQEP